MTRQMQKIQNEPLMKSPASGGIKSARKENYVTHKNYRFAASAAVQSKTGNFAHRTRNEARPHRACPKAFL
jgi:hypothetical protein